LKNYVYGRKIYGERFKANDAEPLQSASRLNINDDESGKIRKDNIKATIVSSSILK
jgi:hypothetical protein